MRMLLLICVAAVGGAIAAVVALLIGAVTGGSFSPAGGALIGMAFGVPAGNLARSPGRSRAGLDSVLGAVAAAAVAWLVVRGVQG